MLLNKLSELKARKSRVDHLLLLLSELNISPGKNLSSIVHEGLFFTEVMGSFMTYVFKSWPIHIRRTLMLL